jgi:hypothetical protein
MIVRPSTTHLLHLLHLLHLSVFFLLRALSLFFSLLKPKKLLEMASTSKRSVTAKLVLLGKQSVGKSSIVTRFVKDSFDEYKDSTIGAAFHSTTVELENTLVKFDIWDTAGARVCMCMRRWNRPGVYVCLCR